MDGDLSVQVPVENDVSGIQGFEELDAMIAAFESGPLVRELKAAGAEAIRDKAEEQYASGRGPSDAVWPLRKKDGALALRRPVGTIVFAETEAGIAAVAEDVMQYHTDRRPWAPPDGELSAPWAAAADEATERVFEEHFRKVR